MDAAQERVAEIVAARDVKPSKRGKAKKPQVALPEPEQTAKAEPTVSDEGKRNADGTFAPGNPGGPGRPSLAGEILKVLAENDLGTGKPNVYRVAVAIVELAKQGSLGHVGVIMERTDGKVSQPVTVEVTANARDVLTGAITRLAAGVAEGAGDSEPD